VSEVVIDGLHEHNVWNIKVFDPIATEAFKNNYQWKARLEYNDNYYDALDWVDALLLLTEWDEFYAPDWKRIKKTMKGNTIIDARNIWDRKIVESYGFTYIAIGR
jgi:UDPglucose 6-dehydrogenase